MPQEYNAKVYYNQGGGDEQMTPRYGVEFLLPYIQHLKDKIIWCPFDKEDSQFVQVLSKNGFKVVYSHLEYGQDFLTYEPEHWDVIISNPPYKNKRKFWERALDFKKPFTLLLPLNILSDSVINVTMREREREFQLLVPSKRMRFYNALTGETGKTPTFKAAYFGVNIFKQPIILADMEIK
ncbi:MAG TPA: tRNA (adenine-N(6)-)-methyltransferase [bacterium]|nr:tRNA (adenine-N(6)-)-methyltransferase [bacterium]